MEGGEVGRRSREPVGPRKVPERRPLSRRQALDESFARRDAPEVYNQLRDDGTVHLQLIRHATIVAFPNYLDKRVVWDRCGTGAAHCR